MSPAARPPAASPAGGTGRPYAGESPADRVARRRRQLLDAGFALIGSLGYRATTVRVLCRRAQVADRYFYEEFEHTEDLLVAVYGECLDRLLTTVTAAVTSLPDDAGLGEVARAGLEAFYDLVQDEPLARIVWLEVLGVSPRVDAVYQDGMQRFADLVLAQLSLRRPDRTPDPQLDPVLATAAAGGISQVATQWVLSSYAAPRTALVEASTRFLEGTAAALERP